MKLEPLDTHHFSESAAEIAELLKRLGIYSTYNGFWQSVCAVRLAGQNPGTFIYPEAAKQFGVNWRVIEGIYEMLLSRLRKQPGPSEGACGIPADKTAQGPSFYLYAVLFIYRHACV